MCIRDSRIAAYAVRPVLQMISALSSIVLLSIGVLFIGRWLAVAIVGGLAVAYWVMTGLITPRLRHAVRQRLRQEKENNEILHESLASVRDIRRNMLLPVSFSPTFHVD